jgi:bifunctional non-homologous end joining protein LigD
VVEALESEPSKEFIADGEIVAFENGITSFSRLQRRGRERVPVLLYLFDLPRHEGQDLRQRPLRERKARLRRALEFGGPLRFNPHRNGEHGEELYREACQKGLEGVMAKRADSPYLSGGRSRDWLKLKCHAEQELVIGGYTAPKGSRTEFGALLVGYYDDSGTLRYAGKVGTGFDQHTLKELGAQLRELEQDESPFEPFKPIPPGTYWVRPELVAQIGFAEWTRDGRLRHPRYLGLRDDKPARDVVRERPS